MDFEEAGVDQPSQPVEESLPATIPGTLEVNTPQDGDSDVIVEHQTLPGPESNQNSSEVPTQPPADTNSAPPPPVPEMRPVAEPGTGTSPMDRADTQELDVGVQKGLENPLSYGPLSVSLHPYGSLVLKPSSFGGWKSSADVVPLKDYLGPEFEKGLVPNENIHGLAPTIISWMQQVAATPCETVWGMEAQKGTNAFATFVGSCSQLKNIDTVVSSTMDAAQVAANKSLFEVVNKVPVNQARIDSKRLILEKWLSKRYIEAQNALQKAQESHDRAAQVFLEEVCGLAEEAYHAYQDEPPLDEDAVFAELDQQVVDSTMGFPVGPEQVAPQSPAPEEVVPQTIAFENIQKMVGDAFNQAGAKIDPAQQEKLQKQLAGIFKENLFEHKEPSGSEAHVEVKKEKLEDEVVPKNELVPAAEKEFQRKDTSQLQDDEARWADHPDAVRDENGEFRLKHKGKLETVSEREARLAHNQYCKFSRTFDSTSCPPEVLELAKGRKHNRPLLQRLFEEWIQSGQNWAQSSIVTNHRSKVGQKKKGRYVYLTWKQVKEKFGHTAATTVRNQKYELEKTRDPNDTSPPWWSKHPELPEDKEWELFRCWDSCELESYEHDETEHHLSHHATADSTQTSQIMSNMKQWHNTLPGLVGTPGNGSAGSAPVTGDSLASQQVPPKPPMEKKPKKEPTMNKKSASKVSSLSSKLTDLKCLRTQIKGSDLSDTMKAAYDEELDKCSVALETTKVSLETWYSHRYEDAKVVGEIKDQYESFMDAADKEIFGYVGTAKSIRNAIAPPKPKAKSKKGKAADPGEEGVARPDVALTMQAAEKPSV